MYLMTLVCRKTREIVGFDVALDKSLDRIQNLIDSSPKAKNYYSDSYFVYDMVSYFGKHDSLMNKSQTYTVEGVNSDLRKYIPALQRRSKCFFRSIDTAKNVLKVFVKAFNSFSLAKFNYPTLKSAYCLTQFI